MIMIMITLMHHRVSYVSFSILKILQHPPAINHWSLLHDNFTIRGGQQRRTKSYAAIIVMIVEIEIESEE